MAQACQNAHDITTSISAPFLTGHIQPECLIYNLANCMHALDKNANHLVKKIKNTTIKAQHPSDPEQLFISFTKTNCQNVSSVLCDSLYARIKKTLTI